ncbi:MULTISPECIES: nicotianamine synthase family protein [Rhodomicrobium]|uniref:nicotianamine synthase family protein n=1 Tax=Rhodomicrobium TaxID=1068 RepID=UPI000B4BF22E|nr:MULTISPECIES: nicotianamine synthase family protein [Rhodomicrobium]
MIEADAIHFLKTTHCRLARQQDLSPNNSEVNHCFGALVSKLKQWHMDGFGGDLLNHPDLAEAARDLPRICARAEYEMEKFWSQKIIDSKAPNATLASFPYYNDYDKLVTDEVALLGCSPRQVLFLGSGPLPLSALVVAKRHPDANIVCIERDEAACQLCRTIVDLFDLDARISVVNSDANTYNSDSVDLIVCAALIEDFNIFDSILASRAEYILAREGDGVVEFFYRRHCQPNSLFCLATTLNSSENKLVTSKLYRKC